MIGAMAGKPMSTEEFIVFMKRLQGDQTDGEFARSVGVSPQYISDIYRGRRVPGKNVVEALGVTRSVVYIVNPIRKGERK